MKPSMTHLGAMTVMVVTLAACAPTHRDFLQDASATCGNPDLLFPAQRSYEARATPAAVNSSYDCVQSFLRASPEYQAGMKGKELDAGYVDALRRIELARSAGQISADDAKVESGMLYRRYQTTIGE